MAAGSLRPSRERPVQAAGGDVYVREWGAESSPAVLFWHALGDHTGLQAAEAARVLVGEFGLRVVALDAPGFGRSTPVVAPEDYALSRLGPLVLSVAETLGLERPAFAGSSWGGSVALAAAAAGTERLRGIVLLDSGYQGPFTEEAPLDDLRRFWRAQPGFRFAGWPEWEADARAHFRRWTPALGELLREGFREEGGEVVSVMGPDAYATVIWTLCREPWTTFVPAVGGSGLPVLLLAATEPPEQENERAADLARFAGLVPQAHVERVPHAGHALLEEQPEAVARTMGDWLRRLYA
jgi:pimeloyl-ACP methyl ester carboxylesterase